MVRYSRVDEGLNGNVWRVGGKMKVKLRADVGGIMDALSECYLNGSSLKELVSCHAVGTENEQEYPKARFRANFRP